MSAHPTRHATDTAHAGGGAQHLTFDFIREHPRVRLYVKMADASLAAIGSK